MKGSSLSWPTENPRARAEWDFRPSFLPENEVTWCHEYELARIRQTQAWRDDIKTFRRESGGSTYEDYWRKAKECLRTRKSSEWPAIFYTLWPEWPIKPYLGVNPNERRKRINDWRCTECPDVLEQISFRDLFKKDRQTLAATRVRVIKLPTKLEIEEVGDTIPDVMGDIVAFRIPGYTDLELVKMFKEWLKKWRKENGSKPSEHLGAGAPVKLLRADLRAIGFWRLVRSGMGRQQAIIYTQGVSGRNLLADFPSAWTRALKRAKDLIF